MKCNSRSRNWFSLLIDYLQTDQLAFAELQIDRLRIFINREFFPVRNEPVGGDCHGVLARLVGNESIMAVLVGVRSWEIVSCSECRNNPTAAPTAGFPSGVVTVPSTPTPLWKVNVAVWAEVRRVAVLSR